MIRLVILCSAILVTVFALDCQQIPDTEIFAGDQFWYPYNSTNYVRIPPNFNCTYVIKSPVTDTQVLYGSVTLTNLLKGVNDYMIVTDSMGARSTLKYRSDSFLEYDIFPGKQISIQVVTKSVDMKSEFLIHVAYSSVKVGPTTQMKSGGFLNYVNLASIKGFDSVLQNSVTVQGNEPISMSLATSAYMFPTLYLFHSYVIDGDFYNQTSVHRLIDFEHATPFVSTQNRITLVTFQTESYYATAAVLNPISEAKQFNPLSSQASVNGEIDRVGLIPEGQDQEACQVLAVDSKTIIMTSVSLGSNVLSSCVAQVVTGPPNNSSQVLLDLTKAQGLMPFTFNLKYFTVIAQGCSFSFTIMSPEH
ncbi:hypothetical protein GCK72_013766 [Caenorhabditis remanei]|uniref:CUB-like domain-containing protein n=1 Tax=Caenorhabditis remanei TaxID=31234 RepID=A0A6A5GRK8_CAERE|nr:hypothetical protein GCK72_013766 [Caenorhabditis remanei]KAF1757311.1 hypothetical protein GCK72_013766 [Caenorhabditis remanei]